MKLSLVVAVAVLSSAVGCPKPTAPTAPTDDVASPDDGQQVAGDGLDTPLGLACAQLRAIGCREGFPDARARNPDGAPRTCYQTFVHASTALGLAVPAECIRTSLLPSVVRRCGTVNMIRVSCAVLVDGGAS